MAHDTLYAIGEALIDMIPAETGCDFGAVSSFAPRVGGAPANVAAAFARLGGRSALLTQLGDDPFGAKITAELAGAGVDVSHIATTDRANTALAFVSLQEDGNRTFSFYRKPSADLLYSPEQVDPALFTTAFALHFYSVSLVESPMREAHKAIRQLTRKIAQSTLLILMCKASCRNSPHNRKRSRVKRAFVPQASDENREATTISPERRGSCRSRTPSEGADHIRFGKVAFDSDDLAGMK